MIKMSFKYNNSAHNASRNHVMRDPVLMKHNAKNY